MKTAEASGKLLRFRDYLPLEVADQVLSILEKLPEAELTYKSTTYR